MSAVQNFFTKILPEAWAESMERESRNWMVKCACGFERSVWEAGGIRWKASGTKMTLVRCPACSKTSMHTIYYKEDA